MRKIYIPLPNISDKDTEKCSKDTLTTEKRGVLKMPDYTGRCMKCKKQVKIKDPKETVMKNGMKACKGTCPACGTKVFRILGKAK